MDQEFKLNGLSEKNLPDLLPGTENDIIRVNSNATDYELTLSGIVTNPASSGLILNSTGANTYAWTNTPECSKITLASGSSSGIRCLTTSTGIDFLSSSGTVNLRSANVVRVSTNTTGVTLAGNITQSGTGNTNSFNGTTTHTGNFTCDGELNLNGTQSVSLVSGNFNSTNGSATTAFLKATGAGTTVLNSVRVVDNNTGLFQSTANQLDLCANGVNGLGLSSSNISSKILHQFLRTPALFPAVYTIAQANTITGSSPPLLIAINPASGNLDFDFQVSTNYFGGACYQIITHNQNAGAGVIRYRAQSTTYHITGGASAVTIASNTYHTLVNDRCHYVICNVNSGSFYLIQT
jgi:hypothetical protein